MFRRKKGFTIIEALIALSVSSLAVATTTNIAIEKLNDQRSQQLSNNIAELISGFDQRLSIDGYLLNRWSKTEWNNTEINDLVNKQLQAINSKCGKGEWQPVDQQNDLKLVGCNLFDKRIFDLEMNVKIQEENQYINGVNIDFNFKNDEEFKENFKKVRKSLFNLRSSNKTSNNGNIFYSWIDKNTNQEINTNQCLTSKTDCILRASIDRQGGANYIRSDGLNSMISNKLTFVESEGDSPLKCVKWTKNGGVWGQEIDESCGIGIFKENGLPLAVDVSANTASFSNVLLNKECDVFEWNGNNVINTGRKSPCGMTENGNTMYQVIDNINSKNALISDLYSNNINSKNALINVANIDEIKSKTINAETLKLTKDLKVEGLTTLKSLKAENTEISGQIKSNSTISNSLNVSGQSNLNALRVNFTDTNNIKVNGTSTVNKIVGSGDFTTRTKMKAPIGDFDNINQMIGDLNDKIEDIPVLKQRGFFNKRFSGRINGMYVGNGYLTENMFHSIKRLSNVSHRFKESFEEVVQRSCDENYFFVTSNYISSSSNYKYIIHECNIPNQKK